MFFGPWVADTPTISILPSCQSFSEQDFGVATITFTQVCEPPVVSLIENIAFYEAFHY